MRIILILFFIFSHPPVMAEDPDAQAEDSLLLNEPRANDEISGGEDGDSDDLDSADDTETVYLDEFKRTEYGDHKYRIQFSGGFNTKATTSNINPGPEQFQSASPYYRVGFLYLGRAAFPSASLARVFSWGTDVIYSKSVAGRVGAFSSSRFEERNMIIAPKLSAETLMPGLSPNVFVHFAFVFNFYVQHETRLITSNYSTKLESPKYKKNILSEVIVPGLEVGIRYKVSDWSAIIQGDTFQGEGNNPWGAFALTGGAVYDF